MRWIRIAGATVVALGLLAFVAVEGLKLAAAARLARTWDVPGVDVPVPWPLSDEEIAAARAARPGTLLTDADLGAIARERSLERGRHLLAARVGCADCHAADFGGAVIVAAAPMGVWAAPNITRAGVTADYTAADWDRIIRHGIARDGTSSTMPSTDFASLSDQELSDLILTITSSPPVARESVASTLGPIRALLLVTGGIPISAELIDHAAARPRTPPPAAVDVAFGRHVALACTGCHGANLSGGPIAGGDPSWPEASNLTPDASGLQGWTAADFRRALREGKSRDGRDLSPVMPWRATQQMTDTEIDAMFAWLQTLPALAKGTR